MKSKNRSASRNEKKIALVETPMRQQLSPKKLSALLAVICAVAGFLLYVNTLGHSYTIDDDTVMQKNKIVTQGIKAVPEILTTPYRKGFWDRQEGMYRPLSLIMFAAEWQTAPAKPFPGHLMNIILYALTGFVLFITLRSLLSTYHIMIPFLATLLFIAHPLHTEVIASIKSRDEILSFLFVILSLFLLFSYVRDGKQMVRLIASVFCFLFALLSKESAVTFVAIIPLSLFFFTGLSAKKITQYSLFFFIPVVFYFGMRYNALHGFVSTAEILPINNSMIDAENLLSRIATAIRILGKYFGLLILPTPLSFDYSYNQIPNVTFGDGLALLSLIVYGAMTFFAIKNFRKKNIFVFCILYFFVTISLVSNLVFLIESTMAERFLYTPSLGFCIALPILLSMFFKGASKKKESHQKNFSSFSKPVTLIVFLIVLLYSVKTISRNAEWKTSYTLLKKDITTSPNSARIRYAYGAELFLNHAMNEKDPYRKASFIDDAIAQLEAGVAILPTYGNAFYQLGMAYTEKKDGANAIRCFESAKKSKTWDEADLFISSGLAYGLAKQYDKAFAEFTKAVEMDPKQKEAFCNWGFYLCEAGKPQEAIEKLNKAISIDAKYTNALYNLGNAYAQEGDFKQAIVYYEKVIALDSTYVDAINNLGNCHVALKEFPLAMQSFEKVLTVDPANFKALNNLGFIYRQSGDEKKAQAYFSKINKQ